MAESSKSFPNIPVTHWLSLRLQFKKSIPGTISSNYVASVLVMTEQNAKVNILPTLRQIGMIDTDGKTNQELAKQLRDDSLYPKFCETIRKNIYPQELQDAFPDKESNRDQIKTWFMNHSGVGNSAAGRIAAFYVALLEADPTINKVPTPSKPKETKSKAVKGKNKPRDISIEEGITEKATSNTEKEKKEKSNGPDLNINLQIHISSDASADQIKNIFENMAKYIYNK